MSRRSPRAAAPRLDHRRLRHRRDQGRLPALLTGEFPDPVDDRAAQGRAAGLRAGPPGAGRRACATRRHRQGCRRRSRRDPWRAGARRRCGAGRAGSGVAFRAGDGVGTVTQPGLPLAVGEPAINPVPRADDARGRRARSRPRIGGAADVEITISIPGGEEMAAPHLEPAARHHRRPVDPRHHRHRASLFLLGLDRLDPSRHRRLPRANGLDPRRRPAPARPPRPACSGSTICRTSPSSTWAISPAAC